MRISDWSSTCALPICFGGNGFAAALSAGIGNSDFRLGGRRDRAKTDSKYLAVHATYGAGGGMRPSFGLAYGWHDIHPPRSVSFAPLAQSLTSGPAGSTLQLYGEVRYDPPGRTEHRRAGKGGVR